MIDVLIFNFALKIMHASYCIFIVVIYKISLKINFIISRNYVFSLNTLSVPNLLLEEIYLAEGTYFL